MIDDTVVRRELMTTREELIRRDEYIKQSLEEQLQHQEKPNSEELADIYRTCEFLEWDDEEEDMMDDLECTESGGVWC